MYIEGLVLPVEKNRLDDYNAWSQRASECFLEHGATRIVESVAEGLEWGEITSFPRAVDLREGEVVFFSWIEFPDKATRDACMEKAFDDPRMGSPDDMPFDGKRMVFGGFHTKLDLS